MRPNGFVSEAGSSHYNRNQSAPTKSEAKEAVKAFRAIAGSPLAKDRNLIWIISDLEKLARS
jgi:hypothetical protein